MKIYAKINTKIIIAALSALMLGAMFSNASLLEDGHYQIISLTITQNDDGRPRGFNNTGLYIAANGRRVTVAGAWRGFPFRRELIVDKTIRDTLVLRDTESMANVFKFHIRNNVVSGRHSLRYDDGSRNIYDTRATIRKLDRLEVDRLRSIVNF